jgi:hypothetical protein
MEAKEVESPLKFIQSNLIRTTTAFSILQRYESSLAFKLTFSGARALHNSSKDKAPDPP